MNARNIKRNTKNLTHLFGKASSKLPGGGTRSQDSNSKLLAVRLLVFFVFFLVSPSIAFSIRFAGGRVRETLFFSEAGRTIFVIFWFSFFFLFFLGGRGGGSLFGRSSAFRAHTGVSISGDDNGQHRFSLSPSPLPDRYCDSRSLGPPRVIPNI